MINLRSKVILTDVDGVLLDWTYSFEHYLKTFYGIVPLKRNIFNMAEAFDVTDKEMVNMITSFNESSHIGRLTPRGDAVHYVQKLYREHGFVFHAITAISQHRDSWTLRQENLAAVFGPRVFEEVICVGHGASKHNALSQYRNSGCIWIEDNMEHAITGLQLGLESYLMTSFHNIKENHPEIPRVNSWREIYDIAI